MKLSQQGIVHLLLLIILLGGIITGVYLVTSGNPLKLFSKASQKKITNPIGTPDYVKMIPFTTGGDIAASSEASSLGKPIYNYSISGSVSFENGSSYVRAVLVDTNNNEHLVYEGYPLISDSNNFSINNVCEETCFLNAVTPRSLRIEGNSSSLNITNTSFSNNLPLSVQTKDIPSQATAAKAQKDILRVEKLTAATDQKKISWTVGETSVSKMTYAEKRKLFVSLDGKPLDHLPNLQGFEYYKGGIFEIPQGGGSLPTSASTPATLSSPSQLSFPASWDWRNRHGANWMTSVKNQGGCGSCWAFAATGATEAITNLYFNQHLDLNLSEQDALSCSGAGNCGGGWPDLTLDYYSRTGVTPEECFPYRGSDLACSKCSNWQNQTVRISGKDYYNWTESWLKQSIIKKGVVSGGIYSWSHTMPLLGWETDTTDNKPVWIFKNSWGGSWGENGYAKLKLELSNIGWTYALLTPVITANNSYSVACVDKDNDGYCNWGIGSKPASCSASCKTEEDCDDSNSSLGPYNANYTCSQLNTTPTSVPSPTPSPVTQSITVGYSNNLIGLVVDKGSNYLAEDFLKELNQAAENKLTKIYKTDPVTDRNITHNLGTTTDNFPIKLGEGYFVSSNNWKGVVTISGTRPQQTTINIPKGNSLISFWQVPSNINKAEALLQAMKAQGIQATQIARFAYGGYEGHVIGYPFNNFDVQTGVGYSIKNTGDTKTFSIVSPTPTPIPTFSPTPTPVVTVSNIETKPSCSDGHPGTPWSTKHLDLQFDAKLAGASNANAVWVKLTDQTTGQSVMVGRQNYSGTLYYNFHDTVSTYTEGKDQPLKLNSDGRTYQLNFYDAPYGNTNPTSLDKLILQTTFSKKCDASPTPTPFTCTACSADADKSGFVNTGDFSLIKACQLKPVTGACANADVNGDKQINGEDITCWQAHLGKQCSTPSPTPAVFTCTACAADINKDGWVNILDFSKLSGCYFKDAAGDCKAADINPDGKVNAKDYACLVSQYNKKC